MKRFFMIIIIGLAFLSTSCERDLDFDTPSEEAAGNLIINAFAVADTSFIVYLNRTYPLSKTPRLVVPDYDHAVFFKDDLSTDYVSYVYYQNTAILNAQVETLVNGQHSYTMTLAPDNMGYLCDYVPKPGDHIVVSAIADGQQAKAETIVPSKPQIEVLEHEVLAQNPYQDENGMFGGTDTIMRLKCRISDIGGERYYRLRIRSERSDHYTISYWNGSSVSQATSFYYYMQDVYFSEDKLFSDVRLTSSMGGWSTNFSTVFDNSLMGSGSYTFTVDSPKASNTSGYIRAINEIKNLEGPEIPTRTMVELQAISPELYRYMKSVQLYRATVDDAYVEPVQIYSNVEGGWGIFGALSYDRHFVEYGE